MKYEWDAGKRARNLRKHGITFEEAMELFEQPYLEATGDPREDGESRFIAMGESRGQVIAVVYTWRGENRRIISARKATKYEREAYYQTLYPGRQ